MGWLYNLDRERRRREERQLEEEEWYTGEPWRVEFGYYDYLLKQASWCDDTEWWEGLSQAQQEAIRAGVRPGTLSLRAAAEQQMPWYRFIGQGTPPADTCRQR